jgi:hypothetical protein
MVDEDWTRVVDARDILGVSLSCLDVITTLLIYKIGFKPNPAMFLF